jgi:transposase
VKDVRDWHSVKNLFDKGVPIKQIARELGMARNTVKNLIKKEEEPKYSRAPAPTIIDDYKDKIREWYLDRRYDFNGTRIYSELLKLGYKGGINPLYRYLQILDTEKTLISRRATVRFETPPGDQAQFDWGEYQMIIAGKRTKIYCFTMILSYSRKKAAICSATVDGTAIYEAIQDLFIELGGVTKELVIDNPKALVISHNKNQEVEFNTSALKLFTYLRTEPNACRPLRPRTKGKIEKPNQYIEEQFIKGNSFDSMEELNVAIKVFMREWNNKIHGTTKRIPNDMFEEERDYLRCINKKMIVVDELEIRSVSNDSYIMVGTNRYSVPVKYVDRQVKIRILYGYILEVYDFDLTLIKKWTILTGRDLKVEDDEDYKEISPKVPSSIPEIRRVFEKTFKNGSDFYELAIRVTNQPHFHAKEFLKLRDLYDISDLEIILKHCIDNNIFKIDNIKSLIKEKYLDLIIEHEKIELALIKAKKDSSKYKLHNEKELVRPLSYYRKGDEI